MFIIKGITQDVTTCQCCGKVGLKKTVALDSETTGVVYYGVDCAALALLGRKSGGSKQTVLTQALAVSLADKLAQLHGLEVAQRAVWNKYGFLGQIRCDVLELGRPVFARISRHG